MSKKSKFIRQIILLILALLILVVMTYPLFWIIATSFKTPGEFQTKPPYALPATFDLSNYIRAFEEANLFTYFKNSIIVTVLGCGGISILASTAAFAIEKMRFKISKVLLTFFLMGIMIPVQVTLIPMFIIYQKMGLLDTQLSLALPQIGFGLPIAIYLFKEFYKYIPNELIDSGICDGCNMSLVYLKIIMPMSRNTFVTVITMNVINIWNEYVLANTFITKDAMKTIPIGLYSFQGEYGSTDWGAMFAAISITVLPILVIYFILNKSVIAGMGAGAVKE